MSSALNIYLNILIFINVGLLKVSAQCQLVGRATDQSKSQKLLKRLEPLQGKTFKYTFKDTDDTDLYQYTMTICDVIPGFKEYTGIIQQYSDQDSMHTKVVGRINSTSIKGGTDWMMLTYQQGQPYRSHCSSAKRQGHIMMICNPNQIEGKFTVLYEENEAVTEPECFYMMELETSVACSNQNTGLSTGSILLIVFVSLFASYILFGMAYKRFVHGAKGMEQVPNISFWKTCGALQADGCDYLCRCRDLGFDNSRPYHGIADDQLDEDEGDDEHLLPM